MVRSSCRQAGSSDFFDSDLPPIFLSSWQNLQDHVSLVDSTAPFSSFTSPCPFLTILRWAPNRDFRDRFHILLSSPNREFRDRLATNRDFRDRFHILLSSPNREFRDRYAPNRDFRDRFHILLSSPNREFRDRYAPNRDFRDRFEEKSLCFAGGSTGARHSVQKLQGVKHYFGPGNMRHWPHHRLLNQPFQSLRASLRPIQPLIRSLRASLGLIQP